MFKILFFLMSPRHMLVANVNIHTVLGYYKHSIKTQFLLKDQLVGKEVK